LLLLTRKESQRCIVRSADSSPAKSKPMVPPRCGCQYMRKVTRLATEGSGSPPDTNVHLEEVCLVQDGDVGCFELSSEACLVLAEIVMSAQRKAVKGNTEAA
jgi:hypothetical protein